jgi:hypothetical protein
MTRTLRRAAETNEFARKHWPPTRRAMFNTKFRMAEKRKVRVACDEEEIGKVDPGFCGYPGLWVDQGL